MQSKLGLRKSKRVQLSQLCRWRTMSMRRKLTKRLTKQSMRRSIKQSRSSRFQLPTTKAWMQ
ncbi:hypothetical protein N799_08615 [Lysobacter arseniciresistens ZS79]|uniref:Uncharacterized protein n=1 Tax=Lysobacter arseniciresistens ZS79 TaxID=913325 RepID=A0A0A0EW77_9GAMM|nr:hypothetical protein N799_08615 [Lysobacter arseniciresistens ZS79]